VHGFVNGERAHRCGKCSSIKNSQVLLGCERDGLNLVFQKGISRRGNLTTTKGGRAMENLNRRIANCMDVY